MKDSPTRSVIPGSDAVIIGCGDIGRRVAQRYIAAGRRATAVLRSKGSAEAAAELGAEVHRIDLDADLSEALPVPDGCHLFWFAPPPREGTDDPRIRRGLNAIANSPACVVYLSTSAVYGDCDGDWVDESAGLRPGTDRGRRRVAAESTLRDWAAGQTLRDIILRVPGIYGPGRLPLRRLKEGLPVVRDEESPYTNRIHAEDLADCAVLAAERAGAGSVYNVSDGRPTTMTDYFLQVADLTGLPRPPVIGWDAAVEQLPESMLGFLRESKRLRVDRLQGELGFVPRYASLADGLAACVSESSDE